MALNEQTASKLEIKTELDIFLVCYVDYFLVVQYVHASVYNVQLIYVTRNYSI